MGYISSLNYAIPIVLMLIGGCKITMHPGVKRWELLLVTSVLFLPFSLMVHLVLTNLGWIVPFKYDQYIFVIDEALGSPSFRVGRLFLEHPWLGTASQAAYNLLPSALWMVGAAYLWTQPIEDALRFIWTNLLNCCLAVPLYVILPVCGPRYAFSTFPTLIPSHVVPHPIALLAPPNGIPSVHMSSALLILYFAKRWRIGMVFGLGYLMLTILSTLGWGEHYVFDLLVGTPFALLVGWLGTKRTVARDERSSLVPNPLQV